MQLELNIGVWPRTAVCADISSCLQGRSGRWGSPHIFMASHVWQPSFALFHQSTDNIMEVHTN